MAENNLEDLPNSKPAKRTRTMEQGLDYAQSAPKSVEATALLPQGTSTLTSDVYSGVEDYFSRRDEVENRQRAMGFDHACTIKASRKEQTANAIIQKLKQLDKQRVYDTAEPRVGFAGQRHPRLVGDHFLSNVELIDRTDLLRVAQRMPKGAHLHIHFNACLLPDVLLGIAKTMNRMFITCDRPLLPDHDYLSYQACEIQFCLIPPERERPGNLFTTTYQPRQTMPFDRFLGEFSSHYPHASADEWLMSKVVFDEEESHNKLQTCAGQVISATFRSLFNYERAYRVYTRWLLEDFVRDNIQYAEIRPNFMETNQLVTDDGTSMINNDGIMAIIIDEYRRFQAQTKGYFGGLKIIYCTPRVFSRDKVRFALNECIRFKKQWPEWIAGFDLVGEEAQPNPLKAFIPEFLEFRQQCRKENLDIPFLFHCGETLDIGTDTDGNLIDALLLNAKRIGHGFALARHPYVMEKMKERGVCLELCPISNEVLGLTPRINGHSMYTLLANNVHCTVSSDNGTFFRSTLSHDFYQVMIGRADMSLHGWRQLIEWSLQHSCMSDGERQGVWVQWEKRWEEFLDWMLVEYGALVADGGVHATADPMPKSE
ncbi:hypothetical protein jhhlp_003230 [Lomentospora prolificans]|uniref:adenosine deaminase n=1 Tax=Lomentospora prolificans TaxID=41688 RepID=A0A2N3NG64_9PEZI|nr:hypothetical protein jhhlp_003230 [Lomentospora prolificans]